MCIGYYSVVIKDKKTWNLKKKRAYLSYYGGIRAHGNGAGAQQLAGLLKAKVEVSGCHILKLKQETEGLSR